MPVAPNPCKLYCRRPASSFHSFEISRRARRLRPRALRPSMGKRKAKGKKHKPTVPLPPLHRYSLAMQQAQAKAKEEKAALLDDAAAYCIENGVLPSKAVELERFSSLGKHEIRYHMNRSGRSEREILTKTEREKIYAWLGASADNTAPVTEEKLGQKVLSVLKARLAYNRAKSHGFGTIKLSKAEKALVTDNKYPSHTWMQKFRASAANHGLSLKTTNSKDAKRAKKQNEQTITNHFAGEFGLEAELLSVDNLDPETKRIKDPRRLLNCDEMPQFLDYLASGKLTRAYGRFGVKLEAAETENRETATLNAAADLTGFLYGLQAIIPRKHFQACMADCCDAPEHALSFDDSILIAEGKSTYALLSKSDKGMQTAETFLDFLKFLVEQIKHRSRLEVAAGKPPIEFPVTLMLDNHASRFSEAVLEQCSREELVGQAEGLGISLFFEESNTSHILQMLDKIFEKLHKAYKTGLKEYKAQHKAKYVHVRLAKTQATGLNVLVLCACAGIMMRWTLAYQNSSKYSVAARTSASKVSGSRGARSATSSAPGATSASARTALTRARSTEITSGNRWLLRRRKPAPPRRASGRRSRRSARQMRARPIRTRRPRRSKTPSKHHLACDRTVLRRCK